MKRCPLCDFIYEDDQSLCDMDGIELVHAQGALVPTHASARGSAVALKSPRKKLSALTLVAAVFGAVCFPVYYLSTNGAAPANADHSPAPVAGQAAPVPALVPAAPEAAPPTLPSAKTPTNEAARADTVAPPARPSPSPSRPRAAKPEGKKLQSERAGEKKESRLGAILNKTGRILKKPFKF